MKLSYQLLSGLCLLTISCILGCVEVLRPFDVLPVGVWRGELQLDKEISLPFNLETIKEKDDSIRIVFINGEERIAVDDISFGKNNDNEDTIRIDFHIYDTHIKAIFKENIMEGHWYVHYKDDYSIPFVAHYGQKHRFSNHASDSQKNIAGQWATTFDVETENAYPAIGEFHQLGEKVTGTFRTETGDYRYLEGQIVNNHLQLSCFDGSHAFLFTADLTNDDNLLGTFYSGTHYKTNWVAVRSDSVSLENPNAISKQSGNLSFEYPNTKNQIISLQDQRFQNKAKLIMIMGTWCPNCLDEARFIKDYITDHPNDQLEVVALAFERYRDPEKSMQSLRRYVSSFEPPFEVLLAGYYDKKEATRSLGIIDKISSYPTLLFVNKNNQITKIHTGFNGPATSKYTQFVEEFKNEVEVITQ